MTDVTNDDRRKWAMAALQTFADVTGTSTEDNGEIQTTVTDLLADLMHLGDKCGFQLTELMESANRHYAAERFE